MTTTAVADIETQVREADSFIAPDSHELHA